MKRSVKREKKVFQQGKKFCGKKLERESEAENFSPLFSWSASDDSSVWKKVLIVTEKKTLAIFIAQSASRTPATHGHTKIIGPLTRYNLEIVLILQRTNCIFMTVCDITLD